MSVAFKFAPLDYVTVTAYGLNYRGRVTEAIWRAPDTLIYDVEYVDDGAKICSGRFREDELEMRKPA